MVVIEIGLGIVAVLMFGAAVSFEVTKKPNIHIGGYWQAGTLALGFLGLLLK